MRRHQYHWRGECFVVGRDLRARLVIVTASVARSFVNARDLV